MSDSKVSFDRVFKPLAKHPFLSVTGMCLLLFFFGFCESSSFTRFSYLYAGAVMLAVYVLLVAFSGICKSVKQAVVVIVTVMTLTAGGLFLMRSYHNSPVILLWLSLILLAALCEVLWLTGSLNERSFIMVMIAAGVMLRLTYDLYSSYTVRQHDVGYFNWTWGHANYIEYWYKNGLKLPDFDVRTIWQYYHPPLHHWIMALLLKILTACGMEYMKAGEALQIIPLIYSSLIPVVCFRIFRFVKLRGMPMVISMAILCFHPFFVLMGGFYNNDPLCVLFMLLSVMFALKWYREPTLKRIIPVALCVGLGMMSKLSGWMVAPAIAVLFLYVFIKNIKSWLKYIGQFALFGAICAPLGLWWQVRNLITFKVPLTYVPFLNPEDPQYSGNMPLTKRLFDFGNGQLSFVYDAYTDPNFGAPFNEYNPTIGLLKTAVFGEGQSAISDIHYPQIAKTGPILFWICVALAVLCFISFIVMMIRKDSGLDGVTRIFFAVLAVTMLGSYYLFCFKFPFTCTMNVRYCVPLIPIFVMGLGLLLQRFTPQTRFGRILHPVTYGLTAAFAVMTCVLFSQVGIPVT
ncbi:ArnT family glycosyltransferase [Ruminococcus sp.]|uniref:ArnT family glycosyltransferase n=1 Tax=Ruminococcus sp. TaxID=41978 RepID=UPI0038904FF3